MHYFLSACLCFVILFEFLAKSPKYTQKILSEIVIKNSLDVVTIAYPYRLFKFFFPEVYQCVYLQFQENVPLFFNNG